MNPKVSMVVINYNDRVRIGRAIESCLQQTYKNIEVIVVDDGSDQETRQEYYRFKDQIKYIQLERTEKKERNPSRPRNAGIKEATGEYICFLDSDNYYSTEFVEKLIKDIKDVAFCDWKIFGKQQLDVQIDKSWNMQDDILKNYITYTRLDHQCLLIRKSLFDEVGLYDERLARSQDCDMLVRLMAKARFWNYIPDYLFFFEKHEDDQLKTTASIYGKALWFLKNDLNLSILSQGYVRNDYNNVLAINQAMNDFRTLDIWKEDFYKSGYKKQIESFNEKLYKEWHE